MIYTRTLEPTKALEIKIEEESLGSFKKLIQRGANLWPDAPASIKEFADVITNGRILQDYKSQDSSKK